MSGRVDAPVKRRLFLLSAASWPLLAVGCKKESPPAPPASRCTDTIGLSAADIEVRARIGYVEPTPFSDKPCSACQHFTLPSANGACGGCKIVPGKIAAAGYCNLFVGSV